jgi:hypothetical protein
MRRENAEEKGTQRYVLAVIAKRRIEQGQQLLWNYNGGKGKGTSPLFNFNCECSKCARKETSLKDTKELKRK